MLSGPLRRALQSGVLFFAALGFIYVPLGRRTGLEHLRAVLSTPEASDAGQEIAEAGRRLADRALGEARGLAGGAASAAASGSEPSAPRGASSTTSAGSPPVPAAPRSSARGARAARAEVRSAGEPPRAEVRSGSDPPLTAVAPGPFANVASLAWLSVISGGPEPRPSGSATAAPPASAR